MIDARQTTERYDGLDMVRAIAMLLGIFYHATYAYIPDVARWYFIADPRAHPIFATIAGSLHSFRMQLFFVVSGFFSHLVFERRGSTQFLIDRFRRLVVPLVVALPLTLAADMWLRTQSHARGLMSPLYASGTALRLAPVHLWFLQYLAFFCLCAWAMALAARFIPSLTQHRRVLHILLALPLAIQAAASDELKPETSFLIQIDSATHFGTFFLFGWLLWTHRHQAIQYLKRLGFMLPLGLAAAIFIHSTSIQYSRVGPLLNAIVAVQITIGALAIAFHVKPQQRPWLRLLVDASYWIYLVHYPLVLWLQLNLTAVNINAWLKYAIVVSATFTIAWIAFLLLIRPTFLAHWLGAKRRVS